MKDIGRGIAVAFIFLMSVYGSRAEEDEDNGDGPEIPPNECDVPKDRLKKTGLQSKYFYAEGESNGLDKTRQFCTQRSLKMAEITSQSDVDHLQLFAEGLPPGEHKFILDYMMHDGAHTNSEGIPMTFQNFAPDVPMEYSTGLSCVVIRYMVNETPRMIQANCEEAAETLCQYTAQDECLKKSAQEVNKEEDAMQFAGTVGQAEIFISNKKTQHEADDVCNERGTSLIVISSQMVNENVFALAREFAATMDIDPRVEFWTNGAMLNGELHWPGGDNTGVELTQQVNYMWGEGSPDREGKSHCVTYSADPENPIDGQIVSTLQTRACDMPEYFMCYSAELPVDFIDSKDMETKMNATTTTEAPEELEIEEESTLPPFFANKELEGGITSRKLGARKSQPAADEKPDCYTIKELPTINLNPDTDMTKEELMTLIKFARTNHIEVDGNSDIPYKSDSQWRYKLIKLIASHYKEVCPGALISSEYINTIVVLISVYFNSLKDDHKESKVGAQVWDEMMTPLAECEKFAIPITLSSKGMFAHEWVLPDENRFHRILVPRETVDKNLFLNTIIDHFWSMFSLTMGDCMALADDPTTWASKYFYNFNKDYLIPLKDAWTKQIGFDMGILMGDFDLETMNYNIRACTTAVYMRAGIADRQLVRPLDLEGKNSMASMNQKTGQAIMNVLS